MKMYNVVIVGATGLVGETILRVLEEQEIKIDKLKLLASKKSVGKAYHLYGKKYFVEELKPEAFEGYDVAFFSAGASVSKEYVKIANSYGLTVIDNSSFFREDKDIPLIVPEINIEDAIPKGIIANPNCSTIQAVIALKKIDEIYGIKGINYTTYQAVSGSGVKGRNDLLGVSEVPFYPHDIKRTCIPEIDVALENNFTKEEMKMVNETRKILHRPELRISATCVRVPVLNCHAVSILLDLEKAFEVEEVRKILSSQEGVVVVDDLKNHLYPTTIMADDNDLVYVGRIRRDLFLENGLLIYTLADNVRKGAASNAVMIYKKMIEKGLV